MFQRITRVINNPNMYLANILSYLINVSNIYVIPNLHYLHLTLEIQRLKSLISIMICLSKLLIADCRRITSCKLCIQLFVLPECLIKCRSLGKGCKLSKIICCNSIALFV